jgi:hypothetical protein
MNWKRQRSLMALSLALHGAAVQAGQVLELTPTSNLSALMGLLRTGDTLRATGVFSSPLVLRNRDFANVTVDATNALFEAGVVLNNVHNITFMGGTFGRSDIDLATWHTFRVDNSSHVSIADARVLGNGDNRGSGVLVANSRFVTVRDSQFSGHMTGIGVRSSADVLVVRNQITGSTADGINIIDNQRVIVAANSCSAFVKWPGAHSDCIQLWGVSGRPLQSNIFVLNNSAIGNFQAYLSSDPKAESGTRLTFAGNYAAVASTHTITCGNCTHSHVFGNVIANLPHAVHGPGSLKLGPSSTNFVGNNLFFDLRGRGDGWMPEPTWTSFVPFIAGQVGSQWDDRSFGFRPALDSDDDSASAVPEPASWLLLGIGFLAVGRQLRRQHGPQTVLA